MSLVWDKEYGVYRQKGVKCDLDEHKTYYDVTYRCSDCEFAFIVRSETKFTPDCPKCSKAPAVKGRSKTKGKEETLKVKTERAKDMVTSGKAPAMRTQSRQSKALDDTMNMVAQDYGLTDLRTNPQQGENLILPESIQKTRDAAEAANLVNTRMKEVGGEARIRNVLFNQMDSGAFRNEPNIANQVQSLGLKPPIKIIAQ